MRLNVDGWDGPIVLAPLAGGPSTPALAAAVSNAAGSGSSPAAISLPTNSTLGSSRSQRALTDRTA
jgi:nitronate monooxygenase